MDGAKEEILTPAENITEEPKLANTEVSDKDGQNKCPSCGSSDIALNPKTAKLRCNYCRHEFMPEKAASLSEDISSLEGIVTASAAADINKEFDSVVTLKCQSCAAEVVIDTADTLQARCHWCRNTLSINQQIPNGAVPDVVLAFKLTKEAAQKNINNFVKKRRFYAHPTFKKEFTADNILGVYFPYMVVDATGHANYSGVGEHQTNAYYVGRDNSRRRLYDADAYSVEREYDVDIIGLTIESSSERLDKSNKTNTNNIINSIMPFDIENCHKYDANYLRGFTSERRDMNIGELDDMVNAQLADVAKFAANESLKDYDRGVAWTKEDFKTKGQQWKAAYLPVWLYSYQQKKLNKNVIHYVAVNARTGETMGSVPMFMPLVILATIIVELLGGYFAIKLNFNERWLFLLTGPIFYFVITNRYRNFSARHTHETDTKTKVSNMRMKDEFLEKRKGLSSSMIVGVNNKSVVGDTSGSKLVKTFLGDNEFSDYLNKKMVTQDGEYDKKEKEAKK